LFHPPTKLLLGKSSTFPTLALLAVILVAKVLALKYYKSSPFLAAIPFIIIDNVIWFTIEIKIKLHQKNLRNKN
jgi:hypothetical protein